MSSPLSRQKWLGSARPLNRQLYYMLLMYRHCYTGSYMPFFCTHSRVVCAGQGTVTGVPWSPSVTSQSLSAPSVTSQSLGPPWPR